MKQAILNSDNTSQLGGLSNINGVCEDPLINQSICVTYRLGLTLFTLEPKARIDKPCKGFNLKGKIVFLVS